MSPTYSSEPADPSTYLPPVPVSSVNNDGEGSLPVLPYAGSSGHSGSEASKERADRDDSDGTTAARQRLVLRALGHAAEHGMTWREFATDYGLHHGQASGPLSVLHKTGHISRLANKRNRCHVYVLPEFVRGREVSPYRANKAASEKLADAGRIRALETEVAELVEVIRDLMGNSGYCVKHAEPEAGCAECQAQRLLQSR